MCGWSLEAPAPRNEALDNIIIAMGDVLETSGHLICQPCGELRLFGYFISVGCWINWSEQAGYTAEQVSF